MMRGVWTVMLAIVIAVAAGCHAPQPSAAKPEPPAGPPPAKTVLALQAFFDDESNAAIKPSWDVALATKGMECAGSEGMRPHMTIGSWQVTPEELQQAIAKAQTLQGRIPSRVMALQPVVREQQGGGLSFNFVPAPDAPGPAIPLADYHRMVHEQLGFKFEPYRPIDLPGQWRAHVTMFSGNAEARGQTEKAIELAKKVEQVRITSFGLVTFGPVKTLAEIKCAPTSGE